MEMHDPFGQCAPGLVFKFEREDRVAILGRLASAVIAHQTPDPADLMFVAAGIHDWLEQGGNLTRDFWRTMAVQGSRNNESQVWKALKASSSGRRQLFSTSVKIESSNKPTEGKSE